MAWSPEGSWFKPVDQTSKLDNALGAAALFGTATSLVSAFTQSSAMRAQGEYMQRMYAINQRYADLQGEDAVKRGEEEVEQIGEKGRQIAGAQRVALAAQGIDVDYGSAADVQQETREAVHLDQMRARTNAWREAWGYKVQAAGYGTQGTMSRLSGDAQARNTLISGATDTVGYGLKSYYYYKKGGA